MKKHVTIHIGEYYAGKEPTIIQTVLGSCVAACLYDSANRIGGMNHILLPGKADMRHFDAAARYGINAMELLINRILTLGGRRAHLTAKVFGGAHVLPAISKENGIGKLNAALVVEFLGIEAIPILSYDLGGTDARRIYFCTDSGTVYLKRVSGRCCPWTAAK